MWLIFLMSCSWQLDSGLCTVFFMCLIIVNFKFLGPRIGNLPFGNHVLSEQCIPIPIPSIACILYFIKEFIREYVIVSSKVYVWPIVCVCLRVCMRGGLKGGYFGLFSGGLLGGYNPPRKWPLASLPIHHLKILWHKCLFCSILPFFY